MQLYSSQKLKSVYNNTKMEHKLMHLNILGLCHSDNSRKLILWIPNCITYIIYNNLDLLIQPIRVARLNRIIHIFDNQAESNNLKLYLTLYLNCLIQLGNHEFAH